MTAATRPWEPAPILNPFHSGRSMRAEVCPVCLRPFRPWKSGVGVYCTNRCNGRARTLGMQRKSMRARERAIAAQIRDEMTAALAAAKERGA